MFVPCRFKQRRLGVCGDIGGNNKIRLFSSDKFLEFRNFRFLQKKKIQKSRESAKKTDAGKRDKNYLFYQKTNVVRLVTPRISDNSPSIFFFNGPVVDEIFVKKEKKTVSERVLFFRESNKRNVRMFKLISKSHIIRGSCKNNNFDLIPQNQKEIVFQKIAGDCAS